MRCLPSGLMSFSTRAMMMSIPLHSCRAIAFCEVERKLKIVGYPPSNPAESQLSKKARNSKARIRTLTLNPKANCLGLGKGLALKVRVRVGVRFGLRLGFWLGAGIVGGFEVDGHGEQASSWC